MRRVQTRFSNWVIGHPILWAVSSGVALVGLGRAADLAPIVVVAAGAAITVLNVVHAKRRGYCPVPQSRPRTGTGVAD